MCKLFDCCYCFVGVYVGLCGGWNVCGELLVVVFDLWWFECLVVFCEWWEGYYCGVVVGCVCGVWGWWRWWIWCIVVCFYILVVKVGRYYVIWCVWLYVDFLYVFCVDVVVYVGWIECGL